MRTLRRRQSARDLISIVAFESSRLRDRYCVLYKYSSEDSRQPSVGAAVRRLRCGGFEDVSNYRIRVACTCERSRTIGQLLPIRTHWKLIHMQGWNGEFRERVDQEFGASAVGSIWSSVLRQSGRTRAGTVPILLWVSIPVSINQRFFYTKASIIETWWRWGSRPPDFGMGDHGVSMKLLLLYL